MTVEPSENKCKKLDVFDSKGKKVATIGSRMHEDFLTHNDSKDSANFKSRMERHRNKAGTLHSMPIRYCRRCSITNSLGADLLGPAAIMPFTLRSGSCVTT